MSDDGLVAVVVIAMLGSPFSPTYARERARRAVDPLDFSAFNVSVSGPAASRWALTERGARSVSRDGASLAIGRSSMRWTAKGALAIEIDERSAPWARRLRGRILFHPAVRTAVGVDLDDQGDHMWWPIAPLGRVEVVLDEPAVRFAGTGYLDANAGAAPLEAAFTRWSWSRVSDAANVAITYDVETRRRSVVQHGYLVGRDGVAALDAGRGIALGTSCFGLPLAMRPPQRMSARLVRTVEDGPFYARSIVECRDRRRVARGVHEMVSLDRFASSWVRFLLPFRMRREAL